MERADQADQNRKFLLILLAAAIPFAVATTLLLTSIFGPSDVGIRCTRQNAAGGRCEVLQSRLLGLGGNSAFPIPQAEIAGARALCARRGVGGRGGPSCSVELLLKSGPYRSYPVLSYPLADQAQSSARMLNDYFADPARASIVLKDELGSTLLISAALPLLVVVALLALVRWRRSRAATPEARAHRSPE